MIKLNKSAKPGILASKEAEWLSDLMPYVYCGAKIPKLVQEKYRHVHVKKALEDECHKKCIYCESKIKHVGYGHIEHLKPKDPKKYPQLTYNWDNLGLACDVCNINKGSDYDEVTPHINPYIDEPSSHFIFCGPMIFFNPLDRRAQLTWQQLQLNRPDLISKRAEAIKAIHRLISLYFSEPNEIIRKSLKCEIIQETSSENEYSAFLKAFVLKMID